MAQKTLVIMEDDIDGSPATQTVTFAFDNTQFEIDLSDENASRFRSAIEPFVKAARRTGGRRGSAPRTGLGAQTTPDNKAVRKWAEANGITVNARGRIPADVIEKYKAAGH